MSSLSFCLFQILPVGGSLFVLHSLTGPPVVRYLMQVATTILPGQGGQFQSMFPLMILL